MKTYNKLFFDFDDTLIDFKAAEKVALPQVFKDFKFPLTKEIEEVYHTINKNLWRMLEQGEVTREQLLERRFKETFAHFHREVDGKEIDEHYRYLLTKTIVLIDDAKQVISELSNNFDLYIVTNGATNTQLSRLEAANLMPYFKQIFVSEQTGYQKPQKQFFDYVFQTIGEVDLAKCLIIGDSYSADMIGGKNAAIDTCWFNPKKLRLPSDYQPTYEIDKLKQVLNIVL